MYFPLCTQPDLTKMNIDDGGALGKCWNIQEHTTAFHNGSDYT